MSSVMYRTDRLYVRPFTKEDMTDTYFSAFYDQEVTKYNSHGLFPYTEKQKGAFLAQLEAADNIIWAILKENASQYSGISETHIGNISLQNINWINRSAEFAVVIWNKNYWGKGYCTEAARLLFAHGFNKLNLHRIWTGTAATNIGMQKVAEKLGMKKEGVFRNAAFLNGQYVDVLEYGILRLEWKLNIPTSSNLYSELGITE
jgi:[ribosomal protein S5]-alanine N-acetyltransferase